jgi:hypothetical protein
MVSQVRPAYHYVQAAPAFCQRLPSSRSELGVASACVYPRLVITPDNHTADLTPGEVRARVCVYVCVCVCVCVWLGMLCVCVCVCV